MPLLRLLRRIATTLTAALVVGASLLTVTAPPAAAATPAGAAFGVQFHGMWSNYTDAQRQHILDQLKAAGVQWIRLDLGWATLQPNGPDSYDMNWGVPFTDQVIDMIHDEGFHLLCTFWRTPGWANAGAGETTLPSDPQTYANAIRWAASRYAGKVDGWEVWNEPNQTDSMRGASPQAYTRLLRAAYPAVHAGDPAAKVVFGGPSENDAPWINQAYLAGAHGYFDVMATHPYMGPSNDPPATPDDGTIYKLTHVAAVHQLMVDHGDGDKPIWFTEFGWSSHANTSSMANWQLGVSRQQQGDYLVATLKLVKAQYPYVTNAFWYEANDENTGTTVNNDNYGLLDSNLAPKPAYTAVANYLASTAAAAPTTDAGTTTADPAGTAVNGTAGPDVSATDPAGTDTTATDPAGTDTTATDPAGTGTTVTELEPTIRIKAPKRVGYRARPQVAARVLAGGQPVTFAPVSVATRVAGGDWRSRGPVQTGSTGWVRVRLHAARTTTVRVAYGTAGSTARVHVAPRIGAHLRDHTVRAGHAVSLRGRVRPGDAGLHVLRERRLHGHWTVVSSTRTRADGSYHFRVVPRAHRAHVYRVAIAPSHGRSAATSAPLRLRVR